MMLWIWRPEVWFTRDQIPPILSVASKMRTSEPWETQWAAADTPVRPAPMMATRGPLRGASGRGALGEKKNMIRRWKRS